MEIVRQATIYPHKITLEARDQFNDYSVKYDHFLTIQYGDGVDQCFDVGTNRKRAIDAYDSAVALAHRSMAQAA